MRRAFAVLGLLAAAPAVAAQAPALPDPTRPADFHRAAAAPITPTEYEQFSLSAIKIAAGRRTAIINGRVVTTGDRVGTAQVTDIQPAGVVLDYREQRLELSLLAHRVKHSTGTTTEVGPR